jgi:hypothetical protein
VQICTLNGGRLHFASDADSEKKDTVANIIRRNAPMLALLSHAAPPQIIFAFLPQVSRSLAKIDSLPLLRN